MASSCNNYFEDFDKATPGAGATIVSIAAGAVPAGWYELEAKFGYLSGTLGTAETATAGGNIQLFLGNTQMGNLSDGFLGAMPQVGVMQGPETFQIYLDGNTSISMVANQASNGTSVVYRGILKLTPLNNVGGIVVGT